MYTKA